MNETDDLISNLPVVGWLVAHPWANLGLLLLCFGWMALRDLARRGER